jgi:Mlc titration factor MtfA (ptsG expression regulator)
MIPGLGAVKKHWRRMSGRRLLRDRDWWLLCSQTAVFQGRTKQECDRLRDLTEAFIDTKSIEGAGGLKVTAQMQCLVAAQACLPILNLGMRYYDGWYSVVLYPGEFRVPHQYVDEAGVVHSGSRELSGEAWHQGPVILSWQDVEGDAWGKERSANVVIHEFAHKLDLLNGKANGMPPLHSNMSRREWTQVFSQAYEDFLAWPTSAGPLPFDSYAATSPGEFFAVTSEVFFMNPRRLYLAFPEVYRLLSRYYRQDPINLESTKSPSPEN